MVEKDKIIKKLKISVIVALAFAFIFLIILIGIGASKRKSGDSFLNPPPENNNTKDREKVIVYQDKLIPTNI
jgi:hypothetical protein